MTKVEAQGKEQIIDVTVKVHVRPGAMFLSVAGATVNAGEFKGSDYVTNISGGSPILYVRHDGQEVATAWIQLQDLLGALLPAVVGAIEAKP